MKTAASIIAIGLVIMFLGGMMWALSQFRGVEFSEPHNITTDAEVTTANVILANKVLDDATTNITLVSNNAGDAPVPWSYTKLTRTLTINGLKPGDTRELTIAYLVPRLDNFIDLIARFFPAFLILGCLVAIVGAVKSAFDR